MDFTNSERQSAFQQRVRDFMDREVRPAIAQYKQERESNERWTSSAVIAGLKVQAKSTGLWNLFMPPLRPEDMIETRFEFSGERLSNVEYALCAEEMGRVAWASEVFNCSAPDTGNMEVLHRYGTAAQKARWLRPLMDGELRSAFLMSEPDVASSDATNVCTSIRRDGDDYVINGRKWWSSGVGDPHCNLAIVMGKSDPEAEPYRQQTMILVDLDTPGVELRRLLPVYGFDHAPHGHGEIVLTDVRVPAANVILGEGRGFEIAQGRLGPGRIHHCMRLIGTAEEALAAMARRLQSRTVFGKRISEHSVWEERIARARIDIDMTRLLCLKAADIMDRAGNKAAQVEIAMIKVQAPMMAQRIIDDAIQAHGGAGVSADFDLASDWANARVLRLADGPDEVHARAIARAELRRHRATAA
ncbi:acyl-CoA dehydrogenase family protein [uncultured Sphingosinicella sp.]|uniref:acyl-CoA dehydrogenase family protein n=1 Tax=uncultured Sphingosinicella sp. TaxID=478748 RepID=UPI0030D9E651|tara:strand:+ start:507 stop:1754 length:1248 start_codon:yes stop_codon:yes gene_type:complete